VSRNIIVSVLGFIYLASSPFCLGQARERDRRREDELQDIRLLKRLVEEQDRRISDLEKNVKALQTAAANLEKPAGDDHVRTGKAPAVAAWQIPFAWSRIKLGMSRLEVEDILGPPTSVDSVMDYQTLIYKGDLAGTGILRGTVKLTGDRVSQVNTPEF